MPKKTFFEFKPAPAQGAFRMPEYWVWCGSPVLGEDGRYHLFASRWTKDVTFLHWAVNSEIVRASADRPEGPYRFEEVVIGPRGAGFWDGMVAHNPSIHFHDGHYLLFYTGSTYTGPRPSTPEDGGLFSPKWIESWNNKRISLAVSKSVFGPWKRPDQPLLQPRPGKWDGVIISNPAPCVREDGSVFLIYKSADVPHSARQYPGRFHLGVAGAPHWSQPFHRLSDEPVKLEGHPDHHLEDPCLWWNGTEYEMLAKDMTGEVCGEAEAGIHCTSKDAITWTLPEKAYTRTILFDDGTQRRMPKRERPAVLLQNGRPTHLFNATLELDAAGQIADSWNCVAPIIA